MKIFSLSILIFFNFEGCITCPSGQTFTSGLTVDIKFLFCPLLMSTNSVTTLIVGVLELPLTEESSLSFDKLTSALQIDKYTNKFASNTPRKKFIFTAIKNTIMTDIVYVQILYCRKCNVNSKKRETQNIDFILLVTTFDILYSFVNTTS